MRGPEQPDLVMRTVKPVMTNVLTKKEHRPNPDRVRKTNVEQAVPIREVPQGDGPERAERADDYVPDAHGEARQRVPGLVTSHSSARVPARARPQSLEPKAQ